MSRGPESDFAQGVRLLVEESGPTNEAEAFRLLQQAAGQGHANAAFHVGVCFHSGIGVQKDDVKATAWLRRAARMDPIPGYSDAFGADLWHYLDESVLRKWAASAPSETDIVRYRQLAEAGCVDAQAHMGLLASYGFGVAQDSSVAVAWFRQAADRGSQVGQWMLAMALASGDGIAQNHAEALMWLRTAHPFMLAAIYHGQLRRELVESAERDIRSRELDRVDRALGTLRLLAEDGYQDAQYRLGLLQLSPPVQDVDSGLRWLTAAAEQGYPPAQGMLGLVLLNGNPPARNTEEGVTWLSRAAHQGHVTSQYHLGTLLAGGRGVPREPEKAYFWLRVAVSGGLPPEYNSDAQATLRALRQDMADTTVLRIDEESSRWQPADESVKRLTSDRSVVHSRRSVGRTSRL